MTDTPAVIDMNEHTPGSGSLMRMIVDIAISSFFVILFFKLLPVGLTFVYSILHAFGEMFMACVTGAINVVLATGNFVFLVTSGIMFVLALVAGLFSAIFGFIAAIFGFFMPNKNKKKDNKKNGAKKPVRGPPPRHQQEQYYHVAFLHYFNSTIMYTDPQK